MEGMRPPDEMGQLDRPRRHTGYWSDEEMWRQIDEMAAEMKAATTPPMVREPSVRGAG
jgi:hypothetical protein